MKIINNSDNFPNLSNEELIKELVSLDESLKLATKLGTGTGGVESIIDAAEKELITRGFYEARIKNRDLLNFNSAESPESRLPTSEEVAAADNAARDFLAQISAVPADERTTLTSDKFSDPVGLVNEKNNSTDKAKQLLLKVDPNYSGSFGTKEIEGVGHLVWQEVRGGGSLIVGNDESVLFFNSSVNPEEAIQAYKDGKRSDESLFNS